MDFEQPILCQSEARFLKLPYELRRMIYDFVFDDEYVTHVYAAENGKLAHIVCDRPNTIWPIGVSQHVYQDKFGQRHEKGAYKAVGVEACGCLSKRAWLSIERKTDRSVAFPRDRIMPWALKRTGSVPSLFFVCRQMYVDTLDLVFSRTTFCFASQGLLSRFNVPEAKLSRMLGLRLHVHGTAGLESFKAEDEKAWKGALQKLSKMTGLKRLFFFIGDDDEANGLMERWYEVDDVIKGWKEPPSSVICRDSPLDTVRQVADFPLWRLYVEPRAAGWTDRWAMGKHPHKYYYIFCSQHRRWFKYPKLCAGCMQDVEEIFPRSPPYISSNLSDDYLEYESREKWFSFGNGTTGPDLPV